MQPSQLGLRSSTTLRSSTLNSLLLLEIGEVVSGSTMKQYCDSVDTPTQGSTQTRGPSRRSSFVGSYIYLQDAAKPQSPS